MVLGSKSLFVHHFGLKFDDVTATLSLIVLSSNFFAVYMYLDTTKFSDQILSRLNGIFVVRKIGQFLLSGALVAALLSILLLSNIRDKKVAPIGKIFSWTDSPRMCLQPKIWLGIKALPIHERN